MDHSGKVAVVTGAAQGLGQAHAHRLAEDGADVAGVDLSPMHDTQRLVESTGQRFIASRCDITDPGAVAGLVKSLSSETDGCDILINNAGVYPIKPVEEIDFDTWRRVLRVNLDGLFLVTQALLPRMREKGWGRIINTTSSSTHMAVPGFVAYMTTKMGTIGFTRALANEVGGSGVTVNAVGPGLVRTPSTELPEAAPGFDTPDQLFEAIAAMQVIHRTEIPEDVVGIVSFLASDDAGFITAQTIFVDGGLARAG